jgi:hypothetical protein
LYRARPVPCGIDYIDPWVQAWPETASKLGKAWASAKLGTTLEPWAVRNASLITGVTEGYYSGMLERNPHLRDQSICAAMPYGNSTRDFDIVARKLMQPYLFDPQDGAFHMVYAGAMLPKADRVLDCLFAALAQLKTVAPDVFARLRVHFIGTGKSPLDPNSHTVLPRSVRFGLDGIVTEHPQRAPYIDVLSHLTQASAILIVGSTEPHYSPSKIYQSVQAGRPIFALLHEASTAIEVLEASNAGVAVRLNQAVLPEPAELAVRLASFVKDSSYRRDQVDWARFEAFSARESARKLGSALDAAIERFDRRLLGAKP